MKQILHKKIIASGYMPLRIKYEDGILEVVAEKTRYKSMSLSDCERLSRILSPFLDAEDLIKESYTLEVTSPGIRRPLLDKEDFRHYKGHSIECTNWRSIMYNGVIEVVHLDGISLRLKNGSEVRISFSDISSARLFY